MVRLLLVFIVFSTKLIAQHEHHATQDSSDERLIFPMTRLGSGTSWLPDSTSAYFYMTQTGKTHLMFHFNQFIRYNRQNILNNSKRSNESIDAPGMFMFMASGEIGKHGQLRANVMLSPDIVTIPGSGYPLLFQTGETWKGEELKDHQHPHDLFSEASVYYSHSFNRGITAFVYTGYPAEPAIGPPAYFHRETGMNSPTAPLGHHWQDATHVSHGVITGGVSREKFQLETSLFNGIEPDENRVKLDPVLLNSYSYRFTVNPNAYSSVQFSQASITQEEQSELTEVHEDSSLTILRTSLSFIHIKPFSGNSRLCTSWVIGINSNDDLFTPSFLFEGLYLKDRYAVFSRFEILTKAAQDLDIETEQKNLILGHFTMGYSHKLMEKKTTVLALGIQGSVFAGEYPLEKEYGNYPVSGEIFLRLYPFRQQEVKPEIKQHKHHVH